MAKEITVTLRTHRGDDYIPLAHQAAFHACPKDIRAIVGAQNSGKSLACAVEVLLEAIRYPGAVVAVGRWALGDLRKSSWVTLRGLIMNTCPQLVRRSTNSTSSLTFELVNGSLIQGIHLQSADSLGSTEWSAAWLEECHEVDEEVFTHVLSRLRPGPPGSYRCLLSGYPERGWLFDRFVTNARKHPDQALFNPRTVDNIHREPGYIERLKRSYSAEQVRILLEGSWAEVAGTIFDKFTPDLHVVKECRLDRSFPRGRSLDPGYDHPAGCLWFASDDMGNLIFTDELREQGMVAEQFAARVMAKSGADQYRLSIIDPSADRRTHGSRVSVFDAYQTAGIRPLRLADNDVAQSIERIRSLLTPDPARKYPSWHPRAGQLGSPRLFFFARCRMLVAELLNYRWQKHGAATAAAGKARPIKEGDDLVDCLRYSCLESLGKPAAETPQLSAFWKEIQAASRPARATQRQQLGFRSV